jgi:hypothetical protein
MPPVAPPVAVADTQAPTAQETAPEAFTTAPTTGLENPNMKSSGAIEGSTYIFYSFVLMMVVVGTGAYFYK